MSDYQAILMTLEHHGVEDAHALAHELETVLRPAEPTGEPCDHCGYHDRLALPLSVRHSAEGRTQLVTRLHLCSTCEGIVLGIIKAMQP